MAKASGFAVSLSKDRMDTFLECVAEERAFAEPVADFEPGGRPVRKQAAQHRTDADFELAFLRQAAARAANGIAAAHFLAVDGGAQRQKLARLKAVNLAQRGWNIQSHRYRAAPLGVDALDGELLKAGSRHRVIFR